MMLSKITRFYILSAGFTAARMGIGATSVVYMMSVGMSLNDIAMIKIIQALIIFFSEVPTGLVADTFGRKASVIVACICSLLSFLFFVSCDSVIGFSVAEIFNGLCIAFWSGAFEALVVEQTEATSKPGPFVEFLFARMGAFNAFATMLGGLAGGFVGDINLHYSFYLATALMLVVLIFTVFFIPSDAVGKTFVRSQKKGLSFSRRVFGALSKMKEHHRLAWKFSLSSEVIRDFFIIQIIVQFSIQPILHYWQPYFQSLSSDVTTNLLGWIFFGYVGGQFLLSGAVSKLFDKRLLTPESANGITAILSLFGFFALWVVNELYISIVFFVVLQASLGVLRNNLGAGFNRFIASHERATILSSVSFISRLGMILNLVILKLTAGMYPVSWVFITSLAAMLMLMPLIYAWNRHLERAHHEPHELAADKA